MSELMRDKVIKEIITSEDAYLHQLHLLDKFFIQSSLNNQIFPPQIHNRIFGHLSTLNQMNQELRSGLGWADGDVGQAFLRLAPFLKAYASYAKNYQQAIELLMEWEGRSSKVRAWLKNSECRPEVSITLPSLLITPVQRIPRYKLLLTELLTHTPSTHPHYNNIQRALAEVVGVAEHIDRSVSDAENLQRTLMIQQALKPPYKTTIVSPGRYLIKEGVLYKVSVHGNTSQARLFFLFSDVLLYTKLPTPTFTPVPSTKCGGEVLGCEYKPGSLECCCMLPLRHCTILPVLGDGSTGLFRIKCDTEDMLLYSTQKDSGQEWVRVLQVAVQQAVQKRKTLRKDSSSRKPLRKTALRKLTIEADAQTILPLRVSKPEEESQSEISTRKPGISKSKSNASKLQPEYSKLQHEQSKLQPKNSKLTENPKLPRISKSEDPDLTENSKSKLENTEILKPKFQLENTLKKLSRSPKLGGTLKMKNLSPRIEQLFKNSTFRNSKHSEMVPLKNLDLGNVKNLNMGNVNNLDMGNVKNLDMGNMKKRERKINIGGRVRKENERVGDMERKEIEEREREIEGREKEEREIGLEEREKNVLIFSPQFWLSPSKREKWRKEEEDEGKKRRKEEDRKKRRKEEEERKNEEKEVTLRKRGRGIRGGDDDGREEGRGGGREEETGARGRTKVNNGRPFSYLSLTSPPPTITPPQ